MIKKRLTQEQMNQKEQTEKMEAEMRHNRICNGFLAAVREADKYGLSVEEMVEIMADKYAGHTYFSDRNMAKCLKETLVFHKAGVENFNKEIGRRLQAAHANIATMLNH